MKLIISIAFLFLGFSLMSQWSFYSDTIPLTLNKHNTIFIQSIFNQQDTLNLNFDTGATDLILTEQTIKHKLKSEISLYDSIYYFKIGKSDYQTKVYDAKLSGHGTDGRFGWNFFKGKVVELNYDLNLMIIHSDLPKKISNNKDYSKVKIVFEKELFLVESTIKQRSIENKSLYLFDIGYQRTIMLDNDLLKEGNFPIESMEVIKKVIMKGAKGNEIPVITANLDLLKIGKFKLKNVPVQHITTNKPIKNRKINILGNEVLKRFNLFIDLRDNYVYMRPNKLFKDRYIDQG